MRLVRQGLMKVDFIDSLEAQLVKRKLQNSLGDRCVREDSRRCFVIFFFDYIIVTKNDRKIFSYI